jgi:hypothetical protein
MSLSSAITNYIADQPRIKLISNANMRNSDIPTFVNQSANEIRGVVTTEDSGFLRLSAQTPSNSCIELIGANISSSAAKFNNSVRISTGGQDAMIINGSRNVGIGTSEPGTGIRLDVVGTARVNSGAATSTALTTTGRIGVNNTNPGFALDLSGGANLVSTGGSTTNNALTTTGRVGINNASPGFALDVSGGANLISIGGLTTNNALTTTGRVGINNASPSVPLDVSGAARIGGTLDMSSNKITNVTTPTVAADAANKSYVDAAETRATAVGSAAQTTANTAKTTADNLVVATNYSTATASAQYLHPGSGNHAGILTNGTWRVFVNSTGNIGIGMSSPSVLLDVAGAAKISGTLDMNNNKITNVTTPTVAADAANKSYVDSALGSSGTQEIRPTVQRNDTRNSDCLLTFVDIGSDPASTSTRRELLRTDGNLTYNANTNSLSVNDLRFVDMYGTKVDSTKGIFRENVGIGTTAPQPQAPLHVFGGTSIDMYTGQARFYNMFGQIGAVGGSRPDNISIISANAIWIQGQQIWITSDQRIKTNIVNLSADKMMNVFRTLRPISFDFIDPMKNNNKKHFGFIAQEVNEVLPEGISLNTDVIPNNMMKGGITKPSETDEKPSFTLKPTDTDISLNYLLVTTDKPIIFDISNSYSSKDIYKFKVYCGKEWSKEHDIYIRSDYNVIDDKYIYVIGMKKDVYDVVLMEPTLFVYGQYVYDLHILEHDTIYTVATAALQEVDRQQQADKARIAELENQVSNLEATVATQQSLINDILERLKSNGM